MRNCMPIRLKEVSKQLVGINLDMSNLRVPYLTRKFALTLLQRNISITLITRVRHIQRIHAWRAQGKYYNEVHKKKRACMKQGAPGSSPARHDLRLGRPTNTSHISFLLLSLKGRDHRLFFPHISWFSKVRSPAHIGSPIFLFPWAKLDRNPTPSPSSIQ